MTSDYDGAADNAPRRQVENTISFGGVPLEAYEGADSGLTFEDAAAVEALPPTSALLIVQRGPNAGSRFLLDAERTSAGRDQASDIFLDDVTVSRSHAEFINEEGHFTVRDTGSLNGTYVNRTRIDSAVLQPGDEVQIGKYRLTFHLNPQAGRAVPPTPAS